MSLPDDLSRLKRRQRPPFSVLSSKYQDSKNVLIQFIEALGDSSWNKSYHSTLLNELKNKWDIYESIYQELNDCISKQGASKEADDYQKEFLYYRAKMKEINEGTRNPVSHLDQSFWSMSSSSKTKFKMAEAKLKSENELALLQSQLKIVDMEKKKEEIQLQIKQKKNEQAVAELAIQLSNESLDYSEVKNKSDTIDSWLNNIMPANIDAKGSSTPKHDQLSHRSFDLQIMNTTKGSTQSILRTSPNPHRPPSGDNPRMENIETRNRQGHRCAEENTAEIRTREVCNPGLDPNTRYLALTELRKAPAKPFDGEPYEFHAWLSDLLQRMEPLNLTPAEKIDIVLSHTKGAPQEVVAKFRTAYCSDKKAAFEIILHKLQTRFGSEVKISSELRGRLSNFPKIKGSDRDPTVARKLIQLSDLCLVINAHMTEVQDLQILNYGTGLEPVREKLPDFVNSRWRQIKEDYILNHGSHPPFYHFCKFLQKVSDSLLSDMHQYESHKDRQVSDTTGKPKLSVLQTELVAEQTHKTSVDPPIFKSTFSCPLHRVDNHKLAECNFFLKEPYKTRMMWLRSLNLCYKCLGAHKFAQCNATVECSVCSSKKHNTALHDNDYAKKFGSKYGNRSNSTKTTATNNTTSPKHNKRTNYVQTPAAANSLCTEICRTKSPVRYSKTILVDITSSHNPDKVMRAYAIIDEQSDNTFALPIIYDELQPPSYIEDYKLKTLSTSHKSSTPFTGRCTNTLVIKGVTERKSFALPKVYENPNLPNTKRQVATPKVLDNHPELSYLAHKFPPIDDDAPVCLLIGTDSGNVMVTETVTRKAPVVHHTALGFAIVGSLCPNHENNTLHNTNVLHTELVTENEHFQATPTFAIKQNVFSNHVDNDAFDLSVEDKIFTNIIENNMHVNKDGNLEMPLPLRQPNKPFPPNKLPVLYRTKSTLIRLRENPKKEQECLKFMQNMINSNHVEEIPPDEIEINHGREWYLPIFPVTHPKKEKVRLVFDSAATYRGTSLNSYLLSGPDQNNNLRGVLLRFREENVGFVADVESMFHSFYVNPEDRDLLRFYWYSDNDPNKPIVPYRAKVHIFGNSCSPSIAITGLRKAAEDYSKKHCDPISQKAALYVKHNFYVDDGLGCAHDVQTAINVLRKSKEALSKYNIHLHKIVSNKTEVTKAFPKSERGVNLTEIDFNECNFHRTLGVAWNIQEDYFTVKVCIPDRPFTKRGILATINSVYDPMGLACPLVLEGKLFQRLILPRKIDVDSFSGLGWDDPLPTEFEMQWEAWKQSLIHLTTLKIQRCLKPENFGEVHSFSIHVFTDASEQAIGHAIYARFMNVDGIIHVSFLHGDSKVAPRAATSMPRLELCAAVEAVQSARKVIMELSNKPENVHYYTDSKVLLGYIQNEQKRFTFYVSRRIEMIRLCSSPDQWSYISTTSNPADYATRPQTAQDILNSCWFEGPHCLWQTDVDFQNNIVAESLPEEAKEKTALSNLHEESEFLFDSLLQLRNSWMFVVNTVVLVLTFCRTLMEKLKKKHETDNSNSNQCKKSKDNQFQDLNEVRKCAENILIRNAQRSVYADTIRYLENNQSLPIKNKLSNLSPFLSDNSLLLVGGRLKNSNLLGTYKHPIILPPDHSITTLIIGYYHKQCYHQGRHVTHGKIRQAGYYIQGGSKMIKKFISNCITCRRLRSSPQTQFMADLPADRVEATAPFTNTGLDVAGPWFVCDGKKTRSTNPSKKVWVVLFTCLSSRAVHLEMIPSLDTTSFKNALRRFVSIRGPCKIIRSDRGTNFVGAKNEDLNMSDVTDDLEKQNCKWIFNPPYSSHMGGAWERKIGQLKRILDFTIKAGSPLSKDELQTLFCEASSVINNTPLWEISEHPDDPLPLSPAMLLNLRSAEPSTSNFNLEDPNYGKKRWRKVQALSDLFWQRWRNSYLQHLQTRERWNKKSQSLAVGDVVLLKDKNTKRNEWPMAKIVKVNESKDGLVRSVHVKASIRTGTLVKSCVYERPITNLVLLLRASEYPQKL